MKIEPSFKIHNLVCTADLQKRFSEIDTINWSYKLYDITENVNDTILSYCNDKLPERYKEALLKTIS